MSSWRGVIELSYGDDEGNSYDLYISLGLLGVYIDYFLPSLYKDSPDIKQSEPPARKPVFLCWRGSVNDRVSSAVELTVDLEGVVWFQPL